MRLPPAGRRPGSRIRACAETLPSLGIVRSVSSSKTKRRHGFTSFGVLQHASMGIAPRNSKRGCRDPSGLPTLKMLGRSLTFS